MANKKLFKPATPGRTPPAADAVNEAGGVAYAFGPKHALAQYVSTGCLSTTFYASDEEQLANTLKLAAEVDPSFIAKAAVYARERGFMKDMPAVLLAVLAARPDKPAQAALRRAFPRVVNNGKMLRNFVQILRSGAVGRKSFGTLPKRLIGEFFAQHDAAWLFRQSVGQKPSLGDVIKLAHPKPASLEHEALFGYLIGKELDGKAERLPAIVKEFELWLAAAGSREVESAITSGTLPKMPVPQVPHEMLTAKPLSSWQWAQIAAQGGWHFTRMNLNTFVRHGVFKENPELIAVVAARLADPEQIKAARVFPYQLLAAYRAVASTDMPREIVNALHDAAELAVDNVPATEGDVYIFPDVSGSMRGPVTGKRGTATTAMRCIDVAALSSVAFARRNAQARIVPVDTAAHPDFRFEPRDSVMTNAERLAGFYGGGTALGEALRWANFECKQVDAAVFISDNESWADRPAYASQVFGSTKIPATSMMAEWGKLKARCPKAKLVCIDLQPNRTTQAGDRGGEVLNVGGWSDACFNVIAAFLRGEKTTWVDAIEAIEL